MFIMVNKRRGLRNVFGLQMHPVLFDRNEGGFTIIKAV